MDILVKIKRLVISRKVIFTSKAREERQSNGITIEEIFESIINAPSIYKTILSTSEFKKKKKEKLYIIIGSTFDGKLIYTKGAIRKINNTEEFYILISSKWSVYE
ncbi:MAG: hypothetical protein HY072_10170 [Deltaproteobacteria bacterium]|nr:hypothetical protein [Deltaproteobacteria bacterium]MBI4924407.1 hypothetical protein [Bdellovibrio sp.]